MKNSAKKYSFYVYQTNYNIFVFQGRVLQEKSQLREGYWRETPKNLGEEGTASKRVKEFLEEGGGRNLQKNYGKPF